MWNYGVIGKILTSPNANINAYIRFYNDELIKNVIVISLGYIYHTYTKSQSYA